MRAVLYRAFGAAGEVLVAEEVADPVPGPGEVLVRIHASGVNPSDVKLRAGSRAGATVGDGIIPHSDGAGIVEAVGHGVPQSRVGERVWLWNAQWRRNHGTAAELVALPATQAVRLPEAASFEEGACLGIPAMTAWAAVLGDGPVEGRTVLVTGGAGAVGRYAVQIARLAGAEVITTVSSPEKAAHASHAHHAINYRTEDVAARVLEITGGRPVDRIVDVDFGGNLATSERLIGEGGTICAYASAGEPNPSVPWNSLMFRNVRIWALIVYLLDPVRRAAGERLLTEWLEDGALDHAVARTFPLSDTAAAHRAVEAGEKLGTIVVTP